MAHTGQEIHGQGGFKLLLIRTAADTAGAVLEMEASYGGTGEFPPEHFHPQQVERFEVLEGSVRAIIDGVEHQYGPREPFEVPPGTPHQMAADQPSRVRWEIRPALHTAEFFERLFGDGPDSAQAADSFSEFLAEFSDEIRMTGR
jgi:quercetin dioxygenase-like cupin family protein